MHGSLLESASPVQSIRKHDTGVERRFYAQLWKALPCGTADLDRVRRVGSQRDCRDTNSEEATDEMDPAHCPQFPRCSHSRAEWQLGKRISTLAPGFPANRGTAPGRGRSVTTPQLCMLSFFAYLLAAPVEYFELRYKGSHRRIKAIITAYVMLFGSTTIWQQQLRWD